jgi:uncharacterized protein (TIGR03000 family)
MFRQMLTKVGVPAVVTAVLVTAGPAWAQHHGGGGVGGGFQSGMPHGGSFQPGGVRSGSFQAGGVRSGSFQPGGFHPNNFHSGSFNRGGYYPGYSYGGYYPGTNYGYSPAASYSPPSSYSPADGYNPPSSYDPSYDLGNDSVPDVGNLDSYGGAARSYSSGYQGFEPSSTVSPDTASAPADPIAHVTVRVPANAELWFDGEITTSKGSVREFQSPPLKPGRYTYEIRARWTENGRDTTHAQKVAVSPGAHMTADFLVPSGTH